MKVAAWFSKNREPKAAFQGHPYQLGICKPGMEKALSTIKWWYFPKDSMRKTHEAVLDLFKGFGRLRAPRDISAPPLSQEHNHSRWRDGPSEDTSTFSELRWVAWLHCFQLHSCKPGSSLFLPTALWLMPAKPCCHCSPAAWLFLEAAERHLHWQNPAKLWSPTAQRHLWVCWKVWHYPLKWNIFEALVISKALIPKLMWENMSLPQNFLVTWTDGFLSQEINLFLLYSHWIG